jgi:hypothetical protein
MGTVASGIIIAPDGFVAVQIIRAHAVFEQMVRDRLNEPQLKNLRHAPRSKEICTHAPPRRVVRALALLTKTCPRKST